MEDIVIEKKNFERINYSLRPAKHVERKMFCEAFGRLSILDNIKNFRYIGMGSAYFSDFSLFHKSLGITKLLSFEGEDDEMSKARINFNKPYSCIDIKFGYSTVILPSLPWSKWREKSIVWLDYVDVLKEFMFSDINTVIFNAKPGSVFAVSVNIEQGDERDTKKNKKNLPAKEFRLETLKENIGSDYIPSRALSMNLNVENNKLIIREIIDNAIRSCLIKRNAGIDSGHEIEYKQLFNIYYRDSADMLTVGGIIYDKNQEPKINSMFQNLDFIREGEESFDIIVPKLTYREIHALDKKLPNQKAEKLGEVNKLGGTIPLPENDIKNYANIYRYFPTFAETSL